MELINSSDELICYSQFYLNLSMNKNNTHIENQNESSLSKPKSKVNSGQSQFTKTKLQRQYEPKIKIFKHKMLKTTQQEKSAQKRIQLQKEEESVAINALQCFKKGEFIDLDWKTKSNFRKSQMSVKFPRINNDILEIGTNLENYSQDKNSLSRLLSSKHSKSVRIKQIEDKCSKLDELLSPNNPNRKSRKTFDLKSQVDNQEDQSRMNKSPKLIEEKSTHTKKSMKSRSHHMQGQNQHLRSFLKQQRVNSQQKDSHIDFALLRSQTEEIKIFNDRQSQQKSQRDKKSRQKINTLPSIDNSDYAISVAENSSSNNLNSISSHTDAPISKSVIINDLRKDLRKNSSANNKTQQSGYDILSDPNIYLLISRSRDKIINWKDSLVLEGMNNKERLKFLQERRSSEPNIGQKRSRRIMGQQNQISTNTLSKQKIISKIQDKKKVNSQKLSKKFTSRVLTETEEFIKSSSINSSIEHSQIYSYLGLKSQNSQQKSIMLLRPKYNKIRQHKRKSLVEVQQKLLKKVKLSFLKQDLTKKFQQIRNQQKLSTFFG